MTLTKGISERVIRDAILTDAIRYPGANIFNLDKKISDLNDISTDDILNVLTEKTVKDYLIYDDFSDDKVVNRDAVYSNIGGEWKVARPEWNVYDGNVSVSNGILTMDAGADMKCDIPYGIHKELLCLKFRFRNKSTPSSGHFTIKFLYYQSSKTIYYMNSPSNNKHGIISVEDGSYNEIVTVSGIISDTSWHEVTIIRTADGNYEYILDGVSKGAGTTTYIPPYSEFLVNNATDVDVDIDYIKFRVGGLIY